MESSGQASAAAVPAHARLIQMGIGYWVSRIVYAAAKLGLADQLAGRRGAKVAALYPIQASRGKSGACSRSQKNKPVEALHRVDLSHLFTC